MTLKEKLKNHHVILGSASPRRQELLKSLDINFKVRVKPVNEVYQPTLKREEITNYLAKLKANAFKNELNDKDILITSDTIVWHNNLAVEKPADKEHAKRMLKDLSNSSHEVITSVSFTTIKEQKTLHCITKVYFKALTEQEIDYYVNNYNPLDKAGAYGIQEWIGCIGVNKIEGSYLNVVGFPLHLVYETLNDMATG
jgi:septum formation protein